MSKFNLSFPRTTKTLCGLILVSGAMLGSAACDSAEPTADGAAAQSVATGPLCTTAEVEQQTTFPCANAAFVASCRQSGGSLCGVPNLPQECACRAQSASPGVPTLPTCHPLDPFGESAESGASCSVLSCGGGTTKCQVQGSNGCRCEAPSAPSPADPFPRCQIDSTPIREFHCPSDGSNPCASSRQVVCREAAASTSCSCM